MKKIGALILGVVMSVMILTVSVSAATSHTVVTGDTMWKIAVKYEVGLSELREANPQIANSNLIYPGQVLTIPTTDSAILK